LFSHLIITNALIKENVWRSHAQRHFSLFIAKSTKRETQKERGGGGGERRERERDINRVSESVRENREHKLTSRETQRETDRERETKREREKIQTHVQQFVESNLLTRGVFYELFGLM
jgi:hypothetical protein